MLITTNRHGKLEARFAERFHMREEFPPPQVFLNVTKMYNSRTGSITFSKFLTPGGGGRGSKIPNWYHLYLNRIKLGSGSSSVMNRRSIIFMLEDSKKACQLTVVVHVWPKTEDKIKEFYTLHPRADLLPNNILISSAVVQSCPSSPLLSPRIISSSTGLTTVRPLASNGSTLAQPGFIFQQFYRQHFFEEQLPTFTTPS
ncbi:hypothetical protein J6590_025786 [Homalodisca vitripennis]|nr:hypothetical protein J6590_025786 [Homalodisca vitripennis]